VAVAPIVTEGTNARNRGIPTLRTAVLIRPFRTGPLAERDFRLLFAATTVTTVGDKVAFIALAFAILELPGTSATDLGLVLAARQAVEALVLLGGGVLSDRLPRHLVLVGASLVQAGAQAMTATLVLTGDATVALLIALQALYGVGSGMIIPAEVGLVPQTVSGERLQQANAALGLSRNLVSVLGPALGGALVVAGSPGLALAGDALSFLLCAALLAQLRVPRRTDGPEREGFLIELREGWREFVSRSWLWTTVLLFGIGNFVGMSWVVLGPAIAEQELGGAGAWATVLTASGVGAIVGGLVAMRLRPSRPLLAAVVAPAPLVLQMAALALYAPVPVIAGASLIAGAGLAVHLTMWFTVFQREVPEHAQSRVSSYDAMGSLVLVPLGAAIAGPVAAHIGASATLWAAVATQVTCLTIMLCLPSVRAIRAPAEA
jgi:predicted MFS family arabinose efflux permease